MRAARAALLGDIHALTTSLGRPPFPSEIAKSRGTTHNATNQALVIAKRDGHVIIGHRASAMTPAPIRVSPTAIIELGLPMVVFFSGPPDALEAWRALELADVTTLTAHPSPGPFAWRLIQACDAVLAIGRADDPAVLGSAAVAYAVASRTPCAVVPKAFLTLGVVAATRDHSILWRAPIALPIAPPVSRQESTGRTI
jgi:hypothetical protein